MEIVYRTKAVNLRSEAYDVYIGRPGPWGNPFSHKDVTLAEHRVATREDAVAAYAKWIQEPEQRDLRAEISKLKGLRLGCFCKPASCHGDVLAALAEGRGWP